ncbi:MAG: hypothetical protein ACPLRZ_01765 [Thermovenabulum sp.]|uniref:hypothetical protein n=1 Tax=Thermovenabulum sp. TaxID=3100335 RepID=UPI003C7B5FD4
MSIIRKFFYGIGIATLAYMLMPNKMKKKMEPMVSKGMDEAKMLAEKGKQILKKNFNEKIENAQDQQNTNEITAEEEVDLKREIQELKATVKALQNEIRETKIY